jgi:hypothetical protein
MFMKRPKEAIEAKRRSRGAIARAGTVSSADVGGR